MRALFEASELEAFCEQVRAAQAAGRTDSHGAIRRIDREQPVPLSYRSSACGSSGNWSRTARPTTSAAWHA
ncbi:hypothetical protein P4233_08820 [Pseudomonas aeruginosa]|nr:hypothetical protein [Pseudomonas aeruginosa]